MTILQQLTLRITEDDIRDAQRFKIRNPILYVLQRQTGTLWCPDGEEFLREAIAPHRNCHLTAEALRQWQEYSDLGYMRPCEIEVEIEVELLEGERQDAVSRVQEHQPMSQPIVFAHALNDQAQ